MIEHDTEQIKLMWPISFKEAIYAKAKELEVTVQTLITSAVTEKYLGDYLQFYLQKNNIVGNLIVTEEDELVLEPMTEQDYMEMENARRQKQQQNI